MEISCRQHPAGSHNLRQEHSKLHLHKGIGAVTANGIYSADDETGTDGKSADAENRALRNARIRSAKLRPLPQLESCRPERADRGRFGSFSTWYKKNPEPDAPE